jgi:hypothetical protein
MDEFGFIEMAVEVPSTYMVTDIVRGNTTWFEEYTHEETAIIRWLCLRDSSNTWRCAACNRGQLESDSEVCNVCGRKVSRRFIPGCVSH